MSSPQYVYHQPSLPWLIKLHMDSYSRLFSLRFRVPNKIRRIFPSSPPISIDGSSLDSSGSRELEGVTINVLPDDVLLHIFHFDRLWCLPWRWHRLVHVCRRWRSVIFASPNFLGLRLVCGPRTRVELTSIWPPLPIIIKNMADSPMPEDYNFDAAIQHQNRVREIKLQYLTSSQLQRLASALREQLPALIHLMLDFDGHPSRRAPALPDGFLGGSAPRLQHLRLDSIPFPALPKLLPSAADLVHLGLWNIPHSGYIPPESIVTSLAGLTNLKILTIGFESPLSLPDQKRRRPPPPTRIILPALTRFEFYGISQYLEDLVARIDAPLLDSIWITFFLQIIFDTPQLAQFMRRTTRFQTLNEAHLDFDDYGCQVESLPPTRGLDEKSRLRISCRELDWQLSSLEQIYTSFFPSIHMVEHLYIYGPQILPSQWQDNIESVHWLEILLSFTSVKNLYASQKFAQCLAHTLQELAEDRMTVLPILESLFVEDLQQSGPIQKTIGQFVAARQLLGYPVAVSQWDRT